MIFFRFAITALALFVTLSIVPFSSPAEANPCNPCANSKVQVRDNHITDYKKLLAMGEKMWNDENLGGSGLSCMSCHTDHESLNIEKHHGVWPHNVHMTNDILTLTQMINFCMLNPMEGKAIDPDSVKMTAMAAFYTDYVQSKLHKPYCAKHKPGKHVCNPCDMKDGKCYGMTKNPCEKCDMRKAINPCEKCDMRKAINPCEKCDMRKNSNPCSKAKNPCNAFAN